MIPILFFCLLFGYTTNIVSTGDGFLPLPASPWLDPETITATVNGDTLSVSLTSRGNTVGLWVSPVPEYGDTVMVTADTLEISVPSVSELDVGTVDDAGELVLPTYYSASNPVQDGLFISGSKRLGVSIGAGGGLSQGTELSITGMLAPGISINGTITDRNLPAGAASSEALADLDRVYIAIDAETWNTEMGDLEWEAGGAVPWRTEATGFFAGLHPTDKLGFSGGYGTTGSEPRKLVFLTEEGLQGPYTFAPGGGVTPGSDRVFLDGVLLQRGSGADYEIDYTAGMITFTTRRLILRDQRVDVSWYQNGDGFRKDLTRLGASVFVSEAFSVEVSAFSKEDNTDVPLGFVMSDEVENALRNAGEDPSDAWIEGGTFVGDGNGDYTRDSLFRYHWEGLNQGDWDVEFQVPPTGAGDYVYDSSTGGYSWAGEGMGTHYPRKYITIPVSIELVSSSLSGRMGVVENYSVFSSYSKKQGNLFNPQETTREGALSGGSATFRPWLGGPSVYLTGRYVSDGFRSPDELESDAESARWGLPPAWKGRDSYIRGEIGGDRLLFSGGRRFLEQGGTSSIAGVNFVPFDAELEISLSLEGLSRAGTTSLRTGERGTAGLQTVFRHGLLSPFLSSSFTGESWADSISGGLFTTELGVLADAGKWNSSLTLGGEKDTRSGISHPSRTLRAALATSGSGVFWNANGSIQHSTGWFEGGGATSSDAVSADYSGRTGGLWIYSRYSAGGYFSKMMDIVYTWVGAGNGDYSYNPDTGEYYPDPSGDYAVTYVPGQGGTRVLEATFDGGFSWSDSLASAGIDGTMKLSASDADNRLKTYTLAAAFDTASPGGWDAALAPYLTWEESVLSRLTLAGSASDRRETYSGAGSTREIFRKLELIPLLKPESWLEIELRAMRAFRRRALYGDRKTEEAGGSIDPVFTPAAGVSVGLTVSGERRWEQDGDTEAFNLGIKPHFSLNRSGWTASGDFSVCYIPGDDLLPSWFFEGRKRGLTLEPGFSVGKNVNRWFNITLFYWGRKLSDSPWTQRAGLNGTVNF